MKNYILYTLLFFAILQYTIIVPFSTTEHEHIFTYIYTSNFWANNESISGLGSTLEQTNVLRQELPRLLSQLSVKTLLDAPCGDFHWMKEIDLQKYYYKGVDIVKELIEKNQRLYGNSKKVFQQLNIVTDALPTVDLILCRDLLGHFPYTDIFQTIKNFKRSGSKYLLVTTYTDPTIINIDWGLGGWRKINLEKPPFNFPKPLLTITEQSTECMGAYADKSLGLWLLDTIILE